jgi:hypothetical protein
VIRTSALILFTILALANVLPGQDDRPLGDVAREARAAKSSSPKSTTVVTNADVPSAKSQVGTGKLSADKQAFCDELRQRKDPAAESSCTVISVDMGSEYEGLTARYFELGKNLCISNKGRNLPSSEPKDPALGAQYRELSGLSAKFMEMMGSEMKTFSDAEGAVNAVRQEEYTEEAAELPDWRNSPALLANPQEKQRFFEIEDKYRSRIQEKEEASHQVKVRGVRFILDDGRMEESCGRH